MANSGPNPGAEAADPVRPPPTAGGAPPAARAEAKRRARLQELVLLSLVGLVGLTIVVDLTGGLGMTPVPDSPIFEYAALALAGAALWHWREQVRYQHRVERALEAQIEAVEKSERRYRDFAEAASHYVWEVGPDLRFTYVSDSIERVTGDRPEEIIGRTREEVRPDDPHCASNARALRRQIAAGVPFADVLVTRLARDGRTVHLMTSGKPFYDEAGNYLGYRCFSRDVTDQIKAERAQRASERRFRDFAEIGAHWLWEHGPDGRFTWVSDSIHRLIGDPPAHMIGKTRAELTGSDPDHQALLRAVEAKVARREPFSDMRLARQTADGRTIHLAISGKPFFDELGEYAGYRGTTRDITAEVAAQKQLADSHAALARTGEALAESERRFRDFAGAASDWFWETGPDHRFTFILHSQAIPPEHRVGSSLGRTRREANPDGASPEDWERHEADLRARRPFRDFRYVRCRGTAQERHLSVNGVPVFDLEGRFVGYRGTGRDITLQVLAEQAAGEAARARDLAEAASRAKSQFLAHTSHELRTPLNAIIGFSEVMAGELLGPIGQPRYREYANDIRTSARHLLDLINDMLDMARIEVGKYRIEPGEVDAAALVEQVLAMTRGLAETAGIELARRGVEPGVRLFVDGRAIKQVLVNLISNSIKFTPSGGRIEVRMARTATGGLAVAVADTGRGIPAAALPTLFEPFQQASAVQARAGGGAGLGLWISRNLMRMHEGELAIESVEGRGTTATLTVPPHRVLGAPAGPARAVA
jgi:PAS domain S-box-containing protein